MIRRRGDTSYVRRLYVLRPLYVLRSMFYVLCSRRKDLTSNVERRTSNADGRRTLFIFAFCLLLFAFCLSPDVFAQGGIPGPLREVGFDQRLNEQAPLDLVFRDENGQMVQLKSYFGSKPVILALVYYECPMLCTQVLNGLVSSLKVLSFNAGDEFIVLSVSFSPGETPALALAKKQSYIERYARPGAADGWHFLTGEEESIQALTRAVGFRYTYDPRTKQYAHASGIVVLTPQGKIARYFYGIEYSPKDLKFGLMEAAANKIGSPVDKILLFCYEYDPATGTYSAIVMNSIRLGGILTLIALVTLLIALRRREKRSAFYLLRSTSKSDAERQMSNVEHRPSNVERRTIPGFLPFMPDRASTVAGDVDALYLFLVAITLLFTFAIAGCEIYFAIKYRRRSPDEVPRPVVGGLSIEIVWTVVPFLIAMVIFFWGAHLYFKLYTPPRDALEIYVTGKQWMWKFQHPEGHREINELHVPIGRKVKLTLATEDVIHSFYVPAFRIKADVVPGKFTTIWFEATKAGRYYLFCAEYCGTNHSGMVGWVEVMEPADYQAWLSGAPVEGSLASLGQKVFQNLACNTCHRSDAQGRGPMLEGLFGKEVQLETGETVVADESYIRESILNPRAKIVAGFQPIMPTFQGLISDEQLLQLIAYIKSLSQEQGAPGAPGAGQQAPQAQPEALRSNPVGPTSPQTARPTPRQ